MFIDEMLCICTRFALLEGTARGSYRPAPTENDALTVELFGTSQRLKSAVGPNRSLAVAKIRRETPTFATEFCGEIPRKLSGKTGVLQKSGFVRRTILVEGNTGLQWLSEEHDALCLLKS